jgi:transposase
MPSLLAPIFSRRPSYGKKKEPPGSSAVQKAKDRAGVVEACINGTITQKQAASMLDVSERQLRRLVASFRAGGADSLIHKSLGKPSNHQLKDGRKEEAVKLCKEVFTDMGPTLAAEMLAERNGLLINHETLRRAMIKEGLWEASSPESRQHRRWRARKACEGELVQMDTSFHHWFGEGTVPTYIISMIDDASSRVFAQMFEADTTENNMRLIKGYIERFGRPIAFYTDRASLFKVNEKDLKKAIAGDSELFKPEPKTQIKRALDELGIGLIFARSPQAKGRVERGFGTMQDRLTKLMSLDRITAIDAANVYLSNYCLPKHNGRFAVEPTSAFNAHRDSKGYGLNSILSIQDTRVVQNDLTVSYKARRYQLEAGHYQGKIRKEKIIVEERLDGTFKARFNNQFFILRLIEGCNVASNFHAIPL